jgi:hypothetical protein
MKLHGRPLCETTAIFWCCGAAGKIRSIPASPTCRVVKSSRTKPAKLPRFARRLKKLSINLGGVTLRHLCDVTTYQRDDRGPKKINRSFFVAFVDGDVEVTPSEEHDRAKWLSLEEAEGVFADSLPKLVCLQGLAGVLEETLPLAG